MINKTLEFNILIKNQRNKTNQSYKNNNNSTTSLTNRQVNIINL